MRLEKQSIEQVKVIALPSGIELAYEESGTGVETLVFIHGMGSTRKAWRKNISVLKEKYRCLALDLPNYGASEKGTFPFTMSFFSGVILEFLAALEVNDPILVGHSMGGQAVLRTLVDVPELCYRAILIAPAGLETFNASEVNWLKKNYTPASVAALSQEQIRKAVEFNFFDFPTDAAFMITDAIAVRSAPHFPLYCEMLSKSVIGMVTDRINGELGTIQAQVLILFGKNDYLIPHPVLHSDQATEDIARAEAVKVPGVRLVLFDECGHFLQWEQSERFNQEVMKFIESIARKSSEK